MKGSLALISVLYIHTHLILIPLCSATPIHIDNGSLTDIGSNSSPPTAGPSFSKSTASFTVSNPALITSTSLTTGASSSAASSITSRTTDISLTPTTTIPVTATNASTSTAQSPTQTVDPTVLQEVEIIHERRLSSIIGALASPDSIPAWLSTLGSDGKWPDDEIDYTTGCAARRANWPAQEHWQRIVVMTGAWHGGLKGADQFVKDEALRSAISLAMDYWFSRDFTNPACLDSGGTASCPCSNEDNSLWNTNWFSNIILIPELVGQSCLLLNDTLAPSQLVDCTRMTGRSYGTFDRNINGAGFLTGANTLDVAKIGIDQALLTVNVSMLTDAYRRVHLELTIKDAVKADGIRADGSFGQHSGILYNGNYGKDYTNDILDIEIEAGGTQFSADSTSQTAFATLFDGDRWMIYRNVLTGVLHWDFSALGRFISFPVVDEQATGSIKINLTEVGELGQQWSSSSLINFASSLSKTTTTANAGNLKGNRMFYNNDYMVHRGRNYVSTVKMFSSRTKNTECTNLQNPLGFHLSDGALHTYLRGDEYEDISVAWDWNLIPGATVDYGATVLDCADTQFTGVEGFVGGVSDGQIGLAAMRYTNPLTKSLHWQKAWFFLEDDVQHVMIANLSSASSAPVYSVLDQRRHSGSILVDGSESRTSNHSGLQSLWHGDVGYSFTDTGNAVSLSIQVGEKTGDWATIGTSTQPPATVDLFAAWIQHNSLNDSISYTAFPGTDRDTFIQKNHKLRLQSVQNDAHVSAIFDEAHETAMVVFWDVSGGSTTLVPSAKAAPITISVNGNVAVIYKIKSGEVTVSDPSQSISAVQVTLALGQGRKPSHWGQGRTKSLIFALPEAGLAGSSATQTIS